MEFKLEPTRLLSDELSYELIIRGNSGAGPVQDKRSQLREILRLEKSGVQLVLDIPLRTTAELNACKQKIQELEEAVVAFCAANYHNECARIGARLTHVTQRVKRIRPEEEQQKEELLSLAERCHNCATELRTKFAQQVSALLADEQERSIREPEAELAEEEPSATSSTQYRARSPPLEARLSAALESLSLSLAERNRPPVPSTTYPVHSWNLLYNGGPGLSNFIERVDELRTARGVSKQQLFTSAVELFEGAALTWYRAKRNTLRNWDELVDALRSNFLPSDYDEQLWVEIRNRTQEAEKRACVYLASMEGLFSRLSKLPSEEERVKHARKNLLPALVNGLGLCEFQRMADLDDTCRKLEDLQKCMQAYKAPPPPSQSLEPDLAYRGAQTVRSGNTTDAPRAGQAPLPSTSRFQPRCWNCRQPGHRSAACRAPPSLHCHRCGMADTTTQNCQRCQGNGRGRR